MSSRQSLLWLGCTLLFCQSASAVTVVNTTLEVACSGTSNSQVAVRWGHPTHDQDEYLKPIFTTKCGTRTHTINVPLNDRDNEFEIQTEGGIRTSYVVKATLNGPRPDGNGFIELNHAGSEEIVVRGDGFSVARSSGPNEYGEQNFRVTLPAGKTATARIVAQSAGDRGDEQLAMRWGHPDFNDTSYFPLWTIKPGPSQSRSFPLGEPKSEFEFQTEGGKGTSYHVSIWLNFGQGEPMQPSIEIAHKNAGTNVTKGFDNVRFSESAGNVYGEMNVKLLVPALPKPQPPTPGGAGGLNIAYNYGEVPISTAGPGKLDIAYRGSLNAGTGMPVVAGARTSFQTNKPNQALNFGPSNLFSDAESNLQPGTWTVLVGTLTSSGQVFDPTRCTAVKIAPGNAPFITVDRPTRKCP